MFIRFLNLVYLLVILRHTIEYVVVKTMAKLTLGLLHCPYTQCGKKFEKPVVLTDSSNLLRETYCACAHCHCKIDISVDTKSGHLLSIDATQTPVDMPPANCKHFFGFLRLIEDDASIPDECAICPKVTQCFVRRS